MPTKILRCDCRPHKFQDSKYGEGMRVFNQTRINDGKTWRCIHCGQEKNLGGEETKKEKKK